MDEIVVRSEYVDAFKPDGSKKPGCTRIDYNAADEEITREYMPEDPRLKPQTGPALAAVLNATPEELALIKQALGIQ